MTTKPPTHRLTERDLDLLHDLGDYRFLSAPQVAALHFPSVGSAERRLRALHAEGLAARVFMPARPYDRQVTTIYALAPAGAKLLAAREEGGHLVPLTDKDKRSALFLEHTLRRNDVRICLALLDRDHPGFQLLLWKQKVEDVRLTTTLPTPTGERERVSVVPDGFFAVRYEGRFYAFCLEVDRGTVNRERMWTRYRAYHQLWTEGALQRRFGALPIRVLTLTNAPARLLTLRHLAAASPGRHRGSGLFWFALLEDANLRAPEALLGPCWTIASTLPGPPRTLFTNPLTSFLCPDPPPSAAPDRGSTATRGDPPPAA